MEKATKEAKVHTSWVSPDAAYDEAVRSFVSSVLADAWFVADLERFLTEQRIVEAGRVNSLAQTVLLFTSPGFADLYQGTELWDHSLVDPDNRRPVDYEIRRRLLAGFGSGIVEGSGDGPPAIDDSGAAKLWVTHRVLEDRRRRPSAYGAESQYRPLTAEGEKADHVVAFGRTGGLVTVVPRLTLGVDLARPWGWGETVLALPEGAWTDVLTGLTCGGGHDVPVAGLLSRFPVAVLARARG
jgi:(1->4)-alpha-D-glucan 1-alpha-D-glucosylmutase